MSRKKISPSVTAKAAYWSDIIFTTKDTKNTKFENLIIRNLRVLRSKISVPPWRPLCPFDVAQGMLCARYSEFRLRLCRASVLAQKLAKKIGGLLIVMPAKAGIQVRDFSWIPGRARYRQLARNDG